jgi:hypothetical protein
VDEEYEADWVGGPVAPLTVDEAVFVEAWDARSSRHHATPGLVKGKLKIQYTDRFPWLVAVELSATVAEGYGYEKGDVLIVDPEWVSRSESVSIMPINSEFSEEHLTGLPEVRVRRHRIVPEASGEAHGS